MLLFGKHVWLRRGEAFLRAFRPLRPLLANRDQGLPATTRASTASRASKRPTLTSANSTSRPYAVGLATRGLVSASIAAFVILALSTVTFDGLTETNAWLEVQDVLHPVFSPLPVDTFGAIDTLGLLVLPVLFLAVYLAFSWVLRQFEGTTDSPVFEVARVFVLSRSSPSPWPTTWPTSSRSSPFRDRGSSRSYPTRSASTGTSSAPPATS